MIKEFDRIIKKQIRKSQKNNSFKKVVKKKAKTVNTIKLTNLSF